jgi:hypothetical protein
LAPAQQNIHPEEVMLEPNDLSKYLNLPSGKEVNKWLENMELQVKTNGMWVPTDKAEGIYAKHAWKTKYKEGYNIKWRVERLVELKYESDRVVQVVTKDSKER